MSRSRSPDPGPLRELKAAEEQLRVAKGDAIAAAARVSDGEKRLFNAKLAVERARVDALTVSDGTYACLSCLQMCKRGPPSHA